MAIGVEVPEPAPHPDRDASTHEAGSAAAQAPEHPGGKLVLLLDAVGRPNGATLDELTASTGWLPHTTRAALTRLRQRGFDVQLATTDGRKAYRLAAAA